MKKFQTLGRSLSRLEMKKVSGGYVKETCSAKAYCGTNGSVSCTGYTTSSGAGCTAGDDKGVACPDQNGTVQWYACPKSTVS